MRFSKIKVISSASLLTLMASINVWGGGPDVVAPVCATCVPAFYPYTYLGIAAGWAFSDWNSFIFDGSSNVFGLTPFVGDVDTNGFVYGGKLGFQATNNFGVEIGGYILPNSDQAIFSHITDSWVNGTVKSWFAYAAGTLRATVPYEPNAHIFTKVGGVYRAVNHSGELYDGVGGGYYWTVLFGAGFDVDLVACNLPFTVGLEYILVPGSLDSWYNPGTSTGIDKNAAPAAHVAVASVSMRFSI